MLIERFNIDIVEQRIGYSFKDKELLNRVFIHRSYLNEHRILGLEHNERLEFLGDAVLELVVTEYLYKNYPNPEGELTNWRSALVKGETLAELANGLGFGDFLLLSKGEAKSGGKSKNYILANTFEALIGALYLDQGYLVCQQFVATHVLVLLEKILKEHLFIDPKSRLQEITQEKFSQTPIYRILGEEGPDHEKQYLVGVFLAEQELARGTGPSKQAGQIAAARKALEIHQDEWLF